MGDKDDKLPASPASRAEVDAFLEKVAATPAQTEPGKRGRLMFAMDATASRQPSWDRAAQIQGQMFQETAALGGLDVQLAFYRGFGEFKVSKWTHEEREMLRLMTSVMCMAGQTQVRKVLAHAVEEAKREHVNAVVFVGDCFEEDVDEVGRVAGELGILGVPVFVFHEGNDPVAAFAFRQIAKLSNGAYCSFDADSPHALRELLGAVAAYAAGGRPALEDLARRHGGAVKQIASQLKGSR